MTPEARLDRLERIAKLFVRDTLRQRQNLRRLDEKIGTLSAELVVEIDAALKASLGIS